MLKTFKHPNLRIESISDLNQDLKKYCVRFSDIDHWNWFTEQELLALWFEEETLQAWYFWNWMISWWEWCYIDTSREVKSIYRYENIDWDVELKYIDWSIFQTKEKAQQFDKMMMTVRRIWKWKKENDDKISNSMYYIVYDKYDNKFSFWNDFDLIDHWFLPSFSSEKKVNQLISDLWEELNNLLCWIK